MVECVQLRRGKEPAAVERGFGVEARVERRVRAPAREDELELPLDGIARVAPVPEQGERAAGTEDAVDLAQCVLGAKPVEGLRDGDSGSASAVPARISMRSRGISSRIASSGSTATTRAPDPASRRVSLPVPAATSTTVFPGASPSSSTAWLG